VLLHFAAQFSDQALGFFGEQLGESERSPALNQCGGEDRGHQRPQQRGVVPSDDVVNEKLGGDWQHHAAKAVDDHQQKAKSQQGAARPDQFLQQRQGAAQMIGSLALRMLHPAISTAVSPVPAVWTHT
jgi:hypothetical protein